MENVTPSRRTVAIVGAVALLTAVAVTAAYPQSAGTLPVLAEVMVMAVTAALVAWWVVSLSAEKARS